MTYIDYVKHMTRNLYTQEVVDNGGRREIIRALKDLAFHAFRVLGILVIGFTGPVSLPLLALAARKNDREWQRQEDEARQQYDFDV